MSGAQRIHDSDLLTERAKHHGVGTYYLSRCDIRADDCHLQIHSLSCKINVMR